LFWNTPALRKIRIAAKWLTIARKGMGRKTRRAALTRLHLAYSIFSSGKTFVGLKRTSPSTSHLTYEKNTISCSGPGRSGFSVPCRGEPEHWDWNPLPPAAGHCKSSGADVLPAAGLCTGVSAGHGRAPESLGSACGRHALLWLRLRLQPATRPPRLRAWERVWARAGPWQSTA
jgi:hypothetical protein